MPVSCPSLLLYCVIWLCSKLVHCHKSSAQLILKCRASAGARENRKSLYTPSPPLLLSQETDRGKQMGVKKGFTETESSLWEKAKACYPTIATLLLQI